MKGSKITKTAGHSFIEEGGQLHKFIVEDRSHSESSEIFALLNGGVGFMVDTPKCNHGLFHQSHFGQANAFAQRDQFKMLTTVHYCAVTAYQES
ncbi:pentatricopeptide repeat-containing protein [Trifolium pratense]|nr:PPR containing plant-like protein [Trifolium pratense]PNY16567.1 pentatricopeptide repeat-containing protein [Trifolium pratense]